MFPNLEAEMARSKITQLQMAEMLQVTPTTLSFKLNGKSCVDADTGHRARREENMSVGELVALGILVVIWIHSLLKN